MKPCRSFRVESLEQRDLLAVDGLAISEVHLAPPGANSQQDEYFEIRGVPGAAIPSGTYFVVVDGSTGESQNPGRVQSVFDLSGLTLGSNGYLAVLQGGGNFWTDRSATTLRGESGFAGLPGNRFDDNNPFGDRLHYQFDSGTFLLVTADDAPRPNLDVDLDNNGQLDSSTGWTVLDSFSVLGTLAGGRSTDVAYGPIVFRVGGNRVAQPGKAVVDLARVNYISRISSSGYAPTDWMAGETRELHDGQFDFEVVARAGNEAYRRYIGRGLDHVGAANFLATVSGTVFRDENGNGSRDAGELGWAGMQVYLDQDGDRAMSSFETLADPDRYLVDDVLTHAFPGVTLSAVNENNQILSAEIRARASGDASTGSLVFSHGDQRLMMDFTNAVQTVRIDFAAVQSSQRGILEAYDREGNRLGMYRTGLLTGTTETMTISRAAADIVFAVAYTDPALPPLGSLDNLRFTQPEQSTTTGLDGRYEFRHVLPRPGVVWEPRPIIGVHELVTISRDTNYALTIPFASNVTGLESGIDDRRPLDIVGRAHTGSWWAALSQGTRFTNEYQTNGATTLNWQDALVGNFRGSQSDLVGRVGDSLWVSENDGTSMNVRVWGQLPYADGWVDVMIGDVNADHRSDWIGRHAGQWWVGVSTADHRFDVQQWSTWSGTAAWRDVQLGDFNGDGRDDIAGRANGQWWIAATTPNQSGFYNQYWGSWSTQVDWEDVRVGDFNGDGFDDIAGRANGRWWVSRSTGSGFAAEYWGAWSNEVVWEDVLLGDFNGDGMDDIAGRTGGTWWVSQSAGDHFVTTSWATWPNAFPWQDVLSGDFNGDGRDDIAGRADGVWWVATSRGRSFETDEWTQWSTQVRWQDVQVGHFNDANVLTAGDVNGVVVVLPGDADKNGRVSFEDFLILSGSFGSIITPGTQADFDHDGRVAFSDFLVLSANFGRAT